MLKHKIINIPIYPGHLEIVVATTPAEVKPIIPHFDKPEVGYHTYYYGKPLDKECYPDKNHLIISIILQNPSILPHDILTYGRVVHECAHAADMIFEHINKKADYEDDEHYAYLIQWVSDQVFKSLKFWNIKLYTI